MIPLRAGTTDEREWREVFINNEYLLPDRMDGWRVLDVGANIGTFTLACLVRGAGDVEAYESDADAYVIYAKALGRFSRVALRVTLRHAAVWRSDVPVRRIQVGRHPCPELTGANGVYEAKDRVSVEAVSLDAEIDGMDHDGKGVDLLKVDAEGAEYPILLTSGELGRVRSVCGEWHSPDPARTAPDGLGSYTANRLQAHLIREGYRTVFTVGECGYQGLFWGTRLPDWPFKGPQ